MIAFIIAASLLAPVTESIEPAPYTLVAWQINTPGFTGTQGVFGAPQTNPVHMYTGSADLDQIKASVPCGRWNQIDLYVNSERTEVLLAGGFLSAPNVPDEHFPPGMTPEQKWITSWYSGDCAPKPEVRPWSEPTDGFTCELVTEYRVSGFYDLSFDPVANVWIENSEPTIVPGTPNTRQPTELEKEGRGCYPPPIPLDPPELAETGVEDSMFALLAWGIILLVAGVVITIGAVAIARTKEES